MMIDTLPTCPICNAPLKWLRRETRSAVCTENQKHRKRVHEIRPGVWALDKKAGPKNNIAKSARISGRIYAHIFAVLSDNGITGQEIINAGVDALREKLTLDFSDTMIYNDYVRQNQVKS